MSHTYHLVCDQCRKKLCIGQADWLYLGSEERDTALTGFLYGHVGHALRFLVDEVAFDLEYEDFTLQEEPEETPDIPAQIKVGNIEIGSGVCWYYDLPKVAK